MRNEVQLITYVDRLTGGGMRDLQSLLDGAMQGLFGGVHILPFFYPYDGADAGFDPIDHTRVDPRLGSWADVKALALGRDIMADVIVNHISTDSEQFRSYSQLGEASEFHDLFLTRDKIFPVVAEESELERIYRPRPGLPFVTATLEDGRQETLWTTFSDKQVDIDVRSSAGRQYLEGILQVLAENGVKALRLDAVGYAIKKPGTSCFMIPETFEFIAEISARARELGMETLVEVHSHYRRQIEIAREVDWVYDFALPPLLLHAFEFSTASYLKNWLSIRPSNAINVLDTHDGIGIIDIGRDRDSVTPSPGLVPSEDLDRVVDSIHRNSDGSSRVATGASALNLDLYQVNCTFYDAMGKEDLRYLIARAIQFFVPGVPQVYYVGLLAGSNDVELLHRTGVGRDINRHHYKLQDLDREMRRPVVRALFQLIRLRNRHAAFFGTFSLAQNGPRELGLIWRDNDNFVELRIDFRAQTKGYAASISFSCAGSIRTVSLEEILAGANLPAQFH